MNCHAPKLRVCLCARRSEPSPSRPRVCAAGRFQWRSRLHEPYKVLVKPDIGYSNIRRGKLTKGLMYVIKVAMGEMLVALALLTNVCALLPTRTRRAAPARISMDYMNPTASGNIGGTAVSTKSQILTESPTGKKQDFLEASPYWDQSTVPVNTWKNKAPYTAKVVSCKRIVGPEATGETFNTASA